MISALFIETNGIYYNDPRIDPWDIERDARLFKGNNKVIAHPPCKRWGRYWSGGPMLAKTPRALKKGNDDNCFAHSLWAVRTFGGVIEHPEASHAYSWFGLTKPPQSGGWVKADNYGGFACCVAQGHYGHRAQKFTWLYSVNNTLPELVWGKCTDKIKLELGPHSKEHAKKLRVMPDYKSQERITVKERLETPKKFKELLIEFVTK